MARPEYIVCIEITGKERFLPENAWYETRKIVIEVYLGIKQLQRWVCMNFYKCI
jgi:hypothetical protein